RRPRRPRPSSVPSGRGHRREAPWVRESPTPGRSTSPRRRPTRCCRWCGRSSATSPSWPANCGGARSTSPASAPARPGTRGERLEAEAEFERGRERMEELVGELRQLGVELKDFFAGLVDFPCWMDGREVYLCWKQGEPEVAHWHEVDAGFAGRQKLLQEAR